MANKVGDQVLLRGFKHAVRLTAVADYPETIVMYGDKSDESTWKATDASEIVVNYHEGARARGSLEKALEESAKGETVDLGDFSQYA